MKRKEIFTNIRQSAAVSIALMVICGLLFPVALWGISSVFFHDQANGSLIKLNGTVIGAEHVGQEFTEPYFMKGRPSAVGYNTYTEDADGNKVKMDGSEYTGVSSGSANYAPSNPELLKRVTRDMNQFLAENPEISREDIPTDLLTASGSGLDPHISPASAAVQVPAIAKASGITEEKLEEIIKRNTKGKLFNLLGEKAVNVLGVNIEIAQEMGLIK